LGTDGFGRSDTRAALRGFFEVDRTHIVLAALQALAQDGLIPAQTPADAIARYAIATEAPSSWSI
jgi:pyruvate dehydrogenase E1 component